MSRDGKSRDSPGGPADGATWIQPVEESMYVPMGCLRNWVSTDMLPGYNRLMGSEQKGVRQTLTVAGVRLLHTIEQLIGRGDVRRVCIIDEEKSILEIPINLGDPAAPASILKAPLMAAINAYGTLVNECTLEVETAEQSARPADQVK